jgi:hypothetical protein
MNPFIVFAGTAKNVDRFIGRMLHHIDDCGAHFKSYAVVLYENDSTDHTRQVMEAQKKPNYHYLYETNVPGRRTEVLARGRNAILDKVLELNAKFMVMLDLDDVNISGQFVTNIETCFSYSGWDVLAGNQKGVYYDVWALRLKGVMEVDCWKQMSLLNGEQRQLLEKYIQTGIHFCGPGLIPVDSAFGGIAIYRVKALQGCRYKGTNEADETCEHVEFHKDIRKNGGKIFINTAFLNDGPMKPLPKPKVQMQLL